nr:tRNA1(Val) (adenine(37)-N6)-methyltransferase [uncultured Desulfobulbus sp.]
MPHVVPRPAITRDTLFAGSLVCNQPTQGYRFSIDAVLVAQFVQPKAHHNVLDLGCGSGIVGLILAYRSAELTVHGLEIQPELACLARENICANGWSGRMQIIEGDACAIEGSIQAETYDLVVCNPPYGTANGGRINPNPQAANARHELCGSLEDFVHAAAFTVRNRGTVVFVYPARRGAALLHILSCNRLTPKRMQPVYSYPEAQTARLLLIEAVKNGGEQFEIMAPFYVYHHKNGPYSQAMQALYLENPSCSPR